MDGIGALSGPRSSEQGAERGERGREVASIALAFLYAAGATLGLAALLLPHGEAVDVAGVAALCIAAYPLAALMLALRPLPWPILHLAVALGTALVTVAVELSDVIAGAYAFYYLWVALFAAYFFSRRGAIVHITLVAVAYGGLILFTGGADEWGFGWLLTVGALAVVAVLVRVLRERVDRLVQQLSHAASTDDLSGLLNRRGFNQRLAEELRRATRSERSLALVVGDLDRFKQINDSFGHPAGDEALRRVSALLHEAARATDTVARLGGEEFALVLPYTERPGAQAMAERIRHTIRSDFSDEGMALTISFGIAVYPDDGDTQDLLMRSADAALYAAKSLGRDRIALPPTKPS
jgi:diguanylate cyclase (GGDEF)-like protein